MTYIVKIRFFDEDNEVEYLPGHVVTDDIAVKFPKFVKELPKDYKTAKPYTVVPFDIDKPAAKK